MTHDTPTLTRKQEELVKQTKKYLAGRVRPDRVRAGLLAVITGLLAGTVATGGQAFKVAYAAATQKEIRA